MDDKVTFDELIELYTLEKNLRSSSNKLFISIVSRFSITIDAVYPDDVDRQAVLLWRKDFLKKIKPATINSYIAYLNSFYKFGIKNNYLKSKFSPFEGLSVKAPISNDRRLSDKKINRIFKFIDDNDVLFNRDPSWFWKTVVMVFYHTGMRVSQLIGLNNQDVDLVDGWIRLRAEHSKNYLEYKVPISDDLNRVLVDYISKRKRIANQFFNIHENRLKFDPKRKDYMNSDDVFYAFGLLSKSVGFRVTSHMFRHTLASDIIKSSGNVVYAQRLLGHLSVQTTTRYIHLDTEDLKETLNDCRK
ncbi:tyrosine-type recombinase/integrase [Nitrincola iocasae]|uniref:Site-specific integrase n=1 Tax=Nitrincola iocasae TaxID=2614693 RepID=A0A5J6LH73_9GAMM|nr:site-specific integrase [Nitrincola iocasae]QEW07616.1 site-specific integrase [Nitrincola iocasae]